MWIVCFFPLSSFLKPGLNCFILKWDFPPVSSDCVLFVWIKENGWTEIQYDNLFLTFCWCMMMTRIDCEQCFCLLTQHWLHHKMVLSYSCSASVISVLSGNANVAGVVLHNSCWNSGKNTDAMFGFIYSIIF